MTLRKIDPRPIPPAAGELRLFSCVYNEQLRLPFFCDYYREQGVDRFFIVDNGSTDGTVELLLAEENVHVFSTTDSFATARSGLDWIEELLGRYAPGSWCLCVDADEIVVYPHCESRTFRDLCRYMEQIRRTALFALLVDMYASGPIRGAHYRAGDNPLKTCPHFDPHTYRDGGSNSRGYPTPAHRRAGLPHFRGGMRQRVFGMDVCLNKVPLFRNLPGVRLTQGCHFIDGARVADLQAATLHFKYFSDLPSRATAAIRRGEHWLGAKSYTDYARILGEQPELSLSCGASRNYEGSNTLVECGISKSSERWDAWRPDLAPAPRSSTAGIPATDGIWLEPSGSE